MMYCKPGNVCCCLISWAFIFGHFTEIIVRGFWKGILCLNSGTNLGISLKTSHLYGYYTINTC